MQANRTPASEQLMLVVEAEGRDDGAVDKDGDVGQELDGENDGGDGTVDGLTARTVTSRVTTA